MNTTTKPRCQDLAPGQAIQWTYVRPPDRRTGPRHPLAMPPQTICERKADDSGWWLTDGTGIDDSVFDGSDEWQVVPA